MRLTHFGHATVLVETAGGGRVLFDPGTYAAGFESLTGLDVIAITHEHPDHADAARLAPLRAANPDAVLVANPAGAAAAGEAQPQDVTVVDGTVVEVGPVRLRPTGELHAPIHPEMPAVANTGFIVDERVLHPGDAFDATPEPVDVLLLPVGGPWMKVSEAIDFARTFVPRVIVPIHQGGLAEIHQQLHYRLLRTLVPDAELVVLEPGAPREV